MLKKSKKYIQISIQHINIYKAGKKFLLLARININENIKNLLNFKKDVYKSINKKYPQCDFEVVLS